ncbi:TerB family tellurite resistance protein [Chitinophaga japonensis]|nr:TerB family tellurite resistance protein [Chitinophaga japonensis]
MMIRKMMLILFIVTAGWIKSWGQAHEIAVLLLNVEKLSQFKQILDDLKTSYRVLSNGYGAIKDISEGNFKLHKLFLDGLMEVSPAVRKYRKIPLTIDYQIQLIKEYRNAYKQFRSSGQFNPGELVYLGQVYDNLFKLSLRNLDELILVTTNGDLRMSDDERIQAIDRICTDMEDKLLFLRDFNQSTSILSLQRARAQRELDVLSTMHGIEE